ncbi:hypothetical protein HOLDEFILI_01219 [Holdemania filiformis DSM 12042]|uniref:Uncharacterized protein n=1 Tax=Holdemania filiformis DSM 12042 TaxID=545696 RepID=B9Y5Y7_9FIRM|nr:hypothetical protein HOLDEFILI_01219 [Holdemania filiformis DSM 12042]
MLCAILKTSLTSSLFLMYSLTFKLFQYLQAGEYIHKFVS